MAGIPRHLLPQIAEKDIPAFRKYLERHGITSKETTCDISRIKPIQTAVNTEKITALKAIPEKLDSAILVTNDGYCVDGHHRWLANRELGRKTINCILCNCPLKQFLTLAHNFSKSFTRGMHEIQQYIHNELSILMGSHGR